MSKRRASIDTFFQDLGEGESFKKAQAEKEAPPPVATQKSEERVGQTNTPAATPPAQVPPQQLPPTPPVSSTPSVPPVTPTAAATPQEQPKETPPAAPPVTPATKKDAPMKPTSIRLDQDMWDDVELLREKLGMGQNEFFIYAIKKEVDAKRDIVDKLKVLKNQMRELE